MLASFPFSLCSIPYFLSWKINRRKICHKLAKIYGMCLKAHYIVNTERLVSKHIGHSKQNVLFSLVPRFLKTKEHFACPRWKYIDVFEAVTARTDWTVGWLIDVIKLAENTVQFDDRKTSSSEVTLHMVGFVNKFRLLYNSGAPNEDRVGIYRGYSRDVTARPASCLCGKRRAAPRRRVM